MRLSLVLLPPRDQLPLALQQVVLDGNYMVAVYSVVAIATWIMQCSLLDMALMPTRITGSSGTAGEAAGVRKDTSGLNVSAMAKNQLALTKPLKMEKLARATRALAHTLGFVASWVVPAIRRA